MAISNAQPVQFWPNGQDTYNEKEVCGIEAFCFCQKFELTDPVIFVASEEMIESGTPDRYYIDFIDSEGNRISFGGGFGSAGYTSLTLGSYLSAGKYQAVIYDSLGDHNYFFYRSDCIDLRESHPCTQLITYSNNRDFAGLVYDGISPTLEYKLRVDIIFFHEEFSGDEEVHPKSDDTFIRLSSRLEKKRKLEVGYMPYYMHEKIQLILMHDNVEIDGLFWEKRDPYRIDDASKGFPLRKASVLLTDKNYIKRNLI